MKQDTFLAMPFLRASFTNAEVFKNGSEPRAAHASSNASCTLNLHSCISPKEGYSINFSAHAPCQLEYSNLDTILLNGLNSTADRKPNP
jgi:hypothetical protein